MEKKDHTRLDLSLFTTISFWSSLGLSLLILTVYILSRPEIRVIPTSGLLEILEAKTLDARFRLRGPVDPGKDIVIIAVDEKTDLEELKSRHDYDLHLARAIQQAGTVVLGMYHFFDEAIECFPAMKRANS